MRTVKERCVTHDVFGCDSCKGVVRRVNENRDEAIGRPEAELIVDLFVEAGEQRLGHWHPRVMELADLLHRKATSVDMWMGQLINVETNEEHGLNPSTSILREVWAERKRPRPPGERMSPVLRNYFVQADEAERLIHLGGACDACIDCGVPLMEVPPRCDHCYAELGGE